MQTRKIFFVGREQGLRIWKARPSLEKYRRGELEGLRAQPRTRRTLAPGRADVVFVRNKPEKTSDAQLEAIGRFVDRLDDGTRLIINPLRSFHTVDSKDRTFSAWSDAGLACPRHWVLKTDPDDPADLACGDQVAALLETESRLLLRTNNEAMGKGIHVVDDAMSPDAILEVLRALKQRTASLRPTRRDTRIIAVEYVDTRDSEGYAVLGRAFVLLGRVIGYFAVVSNWLHFHAGDMGAECFERFVEANRALRRLVEDPARSADLVGAVDTIGNNVGAVDFLMRDGEPVFLEVNPLWGTIPDRPYPFGDTGFEQVLEKTVDSWSKELPNIVENLDPVEFYRQMYGTIAEYADRHDFGIPSEGE